MVLPWSNPPKDVCCLSPSFPSVWKRKKRLRMPTCRQLHSPEKSSTVQCRGCEPAPGPVGCSRCRQCQRDTGWLSAQAGAGLTAELLLL